MGFLDVVLGRKRLKEASDERLFALTTAQVTLNVELGLKTAGSAAVVFKPMSAGEFVRAENEMAQLLDSVAQSSGSKIERKTDDMGFEWLIVRDPDIEDLAVGVNAVSDALAVGGYNDRVLAAVFAFEDADAKPLYLIYNYKRGSWYPFVPAAGDKQRNTERELQIKAATGSELPFEPELERWFPLWGIPI